MEVQGGSLPGIVLEDDMDLGLKIRIHPQYGMVLGSEVIWTMILSQAKVFVERRHEGNINNLVA